MPSLQRWRYKFLMKQKIVTVTLLERWNPATQNNLIVIRYVFQDVISGRMKTAVHKFCARVIPCWIHCTMQINVTLLLLM